MPAWTGRLARFAVSLVVRLRARLAVRPAAGAAAVGVACALCACGFQLRGSHALPFDTIYLGLPQASELRAALARAIAAGTPAKVVDDPKGAQATLVVLGDASTKTILALNAAGRTREFRLVRSFRFKVVNPAGLEWLRDAQVVAYRDMTYSEEQVLSKGFEETLLWRDIQDDVVQQVLRRLALAATPIPVAQK